MQIGRKSRKRSPWWSRLIVGVAASVALPGAALVTASGEPASADEEGVHRTEQGATAPKSPAVDEAGEASLAATQPRLPPELQVVTVRVANSVEHLRPGQPVKILIAEVPPIDDDEVAKGWFHSVDAEIGESSDGPVLIFRVVERPDAERSASPAEP